MDMFKMAVSCELLLSLLSLPIPVLLEECSREYKNHYLGMFTQNWKDRENDRTLLLSSASGHDVHVQITYGNTPGRVLNTVIEPGAGHNITLSKEAGLEMPVGNAIKNLAVLVSATGDVIVEFLDGSDSNTDVFTAREARHLSNEYLVSIPRTVEERGASTVGVAALYDDTHIYITLPNSVSETVYITTETGVLGFEGNINVVLNARDVLQLQTAEDMSGLYILSYLPISVVAGINRTSVPGHCADRAMDQVPPMKTLGTEYIVFTAPIDNGVDFVHIVSTSKNTDVTLHELKYSTVGSTRENISITITEQWGKGEVEIPRISNSFMFLTASTPVLVGLHTQSAERVSDGDASMVYLNPVHLGSSIYSFYDYPSSGMKRKLVIIVLREDTEGVLYDDKPLSDPTWVTVPGSSFSGTYYPILEEGNHIVRHASGARFTAYIYGHALCQCYMFSLPTQDPRHLLRGYSSNTREGNVLWNSPSVSAGVRKTSMKMMFPTVRDLNRCFGFCLMFKDCIGINVPISASTNNCEVPL